MRFDKLSAWWRRLNTRSVPSSSPATTAAALASDEAKGAPVSPEQLQGDTFGLLERMLSTLVEDRKSERRASIIKRVLLLVLLLIPLLYLAVSGLDLHASRREGVAVPVVHIDGVIGSTGDGTSATALVPVLERAFYGAGQRVVLLIHSPGARLVTRSVFGPQSWISSAARISA